MASFSLKHEIDSKCRSINSPVFQKKYPRNQKLRSGASSWDIQQQESFETDQSTMNYLQFNLTEDKGKMEAYTADGYNFLPFENKQILLPDNTHEPLSLSGTTLHTSTQNFSTSVSNDSNFLHGSNSRAMITIHLPSSQILVVNSAACQLSNYTSDELCSMKLEHLIIDSQKPKLSNLYEKFLKSLEGIPQSNEKLLEFVKKDGETISVFIYLKKIDHPERCLAIVEPISRKTGFISVDRNGKILSCDEDVALIFQYDASDFVDVNIYTLLPAINLSKRNDELWKDTKKQQITGRTKSGEVFPVSLEISCGNSNFGEYEVMIWEYIGLNGLILLNKRLLITNFNNYFIKLLFGFSKKDMLNLPIVNLIPEFCKDIGFGTCEKSYSLSSNGDDMNSNYWYGKNESYQNWNENFILDEFWSTLQNTKCTSFNNVMDSPKQYEWLDANLKLDGEKDQDLKILYTHLNSNTNEQNSSDYFQGSYQNITDFTKKTNSSIHTNKKIKKNDAGHSKIFDSCCASCQDEVQEGKFLGYAQHSDGSYIDIIYEVKTVAISEENFYCVWISRDLLSLSDSKKEYFTNVMSSFNNSSVDHSLTRYSVCSEECTRPSTASLISQCDENLTAGDYSQCYTNLRQIGKGAFGYVKMAFRNSDGLLVVTKFIKKRSINIRSWVFNSKLNMKIPLEVSLLITLRHPNIVKVLDVFHNDSFVQLVMEKHGAGFDLFKFINKGPKCDEKLKSYIFRQIISAVYYLNSLGILHRDIKDENVIINEKFEIKLIDFGSATFMPLNETFSKFYGTAGYCSPEVLQGNSYKGPELEIWALGVTLYVLTFGENPFYNIEETIEGKFSIPFLISKSLDELLHQMLDKNVETRITIDKVAQHPWINQPVSVENYRFEEVVKCTEAEAYPPKYVHQINSELLMKDSRTDSNQLDDTNYSSGSLQNVTEMDDFDDDFQEAQKSSLSKFIGRKTNASSILLSSTPMYRKNDRLCKSATAVPNRLGNFFSFSDCSYDCNQNTYAGNYFFLENNYLNHFKTTYSSEKDSGNVQETSGFNDISESDLEMRLKCCCLLEDENLKINNPTHTEVHNKVGFPGCAKEKKTKTESERHSLRNSNYKK